MSPFSAEMAYTTDYLHEATGLHVAVAGSKGEWHAAVRGWIEDGKTQIGVAGYEFTYDRKADATKRAGELLRYVKTLRAAPAPQEPATEAGEVEEPAPSYIPQLRPAGFATLPSGVTFEYIEAPTMFGLANLPHLPTSRYRYGVIRTSRPLTDAECQALDLRAA